VTEVRPGPSTGTRPERDTDFVQSLERGLAVICAFDRTHAELTLSEVAATTGVSRATARRFLLTLCRLGYVRSDGRYFALTPRVLELGYAYLSGLTLAEVAEPHLETLVALVNESSSVSVLDGGDVVYVARVPVSRIMAVAISVGTRFPAYATSMGRVLLAGLSEVDLDGYLGTARLDRLTGRTVTSAASLRAELTKVRSQGFALVDQELEEGLRSIAAPVRDRSGTVVAALNISAHASRTSLEAMRRNLVPPLLAAATRISADLPAASRRPAPRRR
jgi:IclR family transcriptional regulator, pca regulon regulatory protein